MVSEQVYDLAHTKPSSILQYGIGCLDRMASSGDECAQLTRQNLRIIVCPTPFLFSFAYAYRLGVCPHSQLSLREVTLQSSAVSYGTFASSHGQELKAGCQ